MDPVAVEQAEYGGQRDVEHESGQRKLKLGKVKADRQPQHAQNQHGQETKSREDSGDHGGRQFFGLTEHVLDLGQLGVEFGLFGGDITRC